MADKKNMSSPICPMLAMPWSLISPRANWCCIMISIMLLM